MTGPLYIPQSLWDFFMLPLLRRIDMHIEALDAMIVHRENPRRTRSRDAHKRHLAKLKKAAAKSSRRKNR